MLKLEDIKPGMRVRGLVPGHDAKIVATEFVDADTLQVFLTSDLGPAEQQVYRLNEAELSVADSQIPWTFTAPARDFRLALEEVGQSDDCKFHFVFEDYLLQGRVLSDGI